MRSDLEIAKGVCLRPIAEVAEELGIPAEALHPYGHDVAKVDMAFVQGLVTLRMTPIPGAGLQSLLPAASVVVLSALVAYIPLTHMSHFVAKFFAYHAVRWNDEPNLPGSEQEEMIKRVLGYPVSWAADHIRGDGKKTWADVATEQVGQQQGRR